MAKYFTCFLRPPVPSDRFDWTATEDGYDGGDPVGRGVTELDALKDLLDQLADIAADRGETQYTSKPSAVIASQADTIATQAAELTRLRAEAAAARSAGWRAGREAAAVKADEVENEYWSAFDGASATGARKTASAIRAIPEPKEPTDA